jgi:hypothetical protein
VALTAAQIVTIACQTAKCPGFTSQAGQLLNSILSDLCENFDFELARGTSNFNFNPSLSPTAEFPNLQFGAGPYPLPADFLRVADNKEVMWFLLGVPYPMIPVDMSEYDNLVQQAGLQSYPYLYATSMDTQPPIMVVYPPPSGAYPVMVRYFRQMPDITTPETSNVAPWFPNQQYLLTRLSGELMRITDDERWRAFLGEGEDGCVGILDRYLKMKDNQGTRAKTVKLDRRMFGRKFSTLENTKSIGWVFCCAFISHLAISLLGLW